MTMARRGTSVTRFRWLRRRASNGGEQHLKRAMSAFLPGVACQHLWGGFEYTAAVEKLLEADPATLALLRNDPFRGKRPRFVRARFYRYRFADRRRRKSTGVWWERTYVDEYLRPLALPSSRTG